MNGTAVEGVGVPVEADEFAAWVDPHLLAMTRLAGRLVPAAERDDVVQEALVRAWRRRSTYDAARGTVTGWLLAIVADCARRSRTRAPREVLGSAALDRPVADHATDVDLERALTTLPARQRLAVALFYFVGMDVAETAVVMGCSVGTVKATLHHARGRLREHLGVLDD